MYSTKEMWTRPLPDKMQATVIALLVLFTGLHAQTCSIPLGIANPSIISRDRIVTSSEMAGHGKDQIRLNCCQDKLGQAWCPNATDKNPYVEIHLEKPTVISAIVFQPPTSDPYSRPVNFMKTFDLLFKLPGLKELVTIAKDIGAIVNNTISSSTISLQQPIVTDLIRIEPKQSENNSCFRMELYTCDVTTLCPTNYCQNKGECSGLNTCNCSASFFGERCEYSRETIPITLYEFVQIISNTIITRTETLTFYGDVTMDIDNSLILKPGGYVDLNFKADSCYKDLDTCFSGFTLSLVFSFSKLDANTQIVLTNGAGIQPGIKGVTLMFNNGELQCYVSTSTQIWIVKKMFTLEELKWYDISISWSLNQGLIVLQGDTLVGSSFNSLTTQSVTTNMFMIGFSNIVTSAELHWKTLITIPLFWEECKRAGLFTGTYTTTPSLTTTVQRVTTTPSLATTVQRVTTSQVEACSIPLGVADSSIISRDRIVTSSDMAGHGKDQIRLNCCQEKLGQAWCPAVNDKNPYVEIHLEKPTVISAIVFQPPTVDTYSRPVNFMKTFDLLFKLPGLKELVTIAKDIGAIVNNTVSASTISLQQPIVTDLIRIEPKQSENNSCFRMELYTCDVTTLCPTKYCQNKGECSGLNTCNCSASFFGERCEYSRETIPITLYEFIRITINTIITRTQTLTFHGNVTMDIDNSLILKPGSYVDLNFTADSCYKDLDTCFSGFTLSLVFSFSKLDTNTQIVLTNGAGIQPGIKGVTLMFNKGELQCYVSTSTQIWIVKKMFTLEELIWYDISISWSLNQGLIVLQGDTLVGSSFNSLTTQSVTTNMFMIGFSNIMTSAELHWKTLITIPLFWEECKRAGLFTGAYTTTPSLTTTVQRVTTAPSLATTVQRVTTSQVEACSIPLGVADSSIISRDRIVTSSDMAGHGKDQIRLNCCQEKLGQAWCPAVNDKNPYVEIHLEKPTVISAIVFQPPTVDTYSRPVNFMKTFDLLFKLPGLKELVTIAKDIGAIVNNTVSASTISLQQPIVTDLIRIEPKQSENNSCFRMELYTCDVTTLCPTKYCQNKGECSGLNTCNCSASFFGERCEYSRETIPITLYEFIRITINTIITRTQTLTFHGNVTMDIDNSLILKPGSYVDLNFTADSCYKDLDTCFSGFTLSLVFSFSKLDTNTQIVLTNGAGIQPGIKGVTLMFNKGELQCYVSTSTQIWIVKKMFTLEELIWYDISISWSLNQGLIVLQGDTLVGSSFNSLTTQSVTTNMFMIGFSNIMTSAELHWKTLITIPLFWEECKRAGLFTGAYTTTPSLTTTVQRVTTAPSLATTVQRVTTSQVEACSIPLGVADSSIISRDRIVTSSDMAGHGKDQIRLNCCQEKLGQAWCPAVNDKNPYVEIHLEKPTVISAIVFQPPTVDTYSRPVNFMKTFDLLFKLPGLKELVTIAKDIGAIVNNTVSASTISLQQPIVTDLIRIEPKQSENNSCFRMELYTCDVTTLCPTKYCQNKGECSGLNTCNCSASFFGERCEYSRETIPITLYEFIRITINTIITRTQTLTFHGNVTMDIDNSLILKPGSYVDLNFTADSCYKDLDTCFSGFTLSLVFSFSKLDTNTQIVLTNGAGIQPGIKGVTLMFNKGELQCYVSTSTQIWIVKKMFTLEELIWYDISISWSLNQGLIVLQGDTLVGSSFNSLTTQSVTTNMFMIGFSNIMTSAELHWKTLITIPLFWEECKRAGLFTGAYTTTPSLTTTVQRVTTTPSLATTVQTVTTSQVEVCRTALGMEDGTITSTHITASSSMAGHGTEQARPGCCKNQELGAWCAAPTDDHPWIQVDLPRPTALSAISFHLPEGSRISAFPANYVQLVMVKYRNVVSESTYLELYSESMQASQNGTITYNAALQPPIVTDTLRIFLTKYVGLPCLRFELIGCDVTDLCPPNFCENSAQCIGENVCLCKDGFYGEKCQLSNIEHKEIGFHEIVNNTITTNDASTNLTTAGNVSLIIVNNTTVIQLTSGGTVTFHEDKCLQHLDNCKSGFTLTLEVSLVTISDDKVLICTSGGHKDNTQGLALVYNRLEHKLTFTVTTHTYYWTISSTFIWQEATWHKVVLTWHASAGIKLVVDGILIGSAVGSHVSLPADKTDLLCFGCSLVGVKTTSTIVIKVVDHFYVFITDLIRAGLITVTSLPDLTSTKIPKTTQESGVQIVDYFWNLTDLSQTVSHNLQLILIGNPTIGVDGVILTTDHEKIEIQNLNSTCLTNPILCTNGLTIEIRIKFVVLEEDTVIFTTGGENPDHPGVTLLYRYGFLHAIVSTTNLSWYVSVSRKTIWTNDFFNIIVSWSHDTTLKLIINEVLIGESEGPVHYPNRTGPTTNTLTIGGGNTHCILSQLHLWFFHVDILTKFGFVSCNFCSQEKTTAKLTDSTSTVSSSTKYEKCSVGCVPLDMCVTEPTQPSRVPTLPPACEVSTPTSSFPKTTVESTPPICLQPICEQSTKSPAPTTTAKPTSSATTVQSTPPICSQPICEQQTTAKPPAQTTIERTPKPTAPTTPVVATPKPPAQTTTIEPTPKPTAPTTPVVATPKPPAQTTTVEPTPKPTAPTTPVEATPKPPAPTTPDEITTTTRQTCPPPVPSVTLTPEVNINGQGQLTCSVTESLKQGITIRFTWYIEGSNNIGTKVIEAPDRSASISVTEIQTSILKKKITCTAEIKFLTPDALWCWPVTSDVFVPAIQCPPKPNIIYVIEGEEQYNLTVNITVPPSLLCLPQDNGQCRVEVITTIRTESNELKCSPNEIIPQAVLGVSTVGQGGGLSCGVSITSNNWKNSVIIPIKATVDGIRDNTQRRKLQISVRVVGQISLETFVENCDENEIVVTDRDEVSTCSSVNDPHMKGFDDLRFNNFIPGEFTLYKHTSVENEVRALYRPCNAIFPRGATCNCGVAVRSGDDVITFDSCDTRQNKLSFIGNSVISVFMYKNGELTPGTRVLRHGCGQKYEVHLPTGTKVTITATRKPFINIHIQASSNDFKKTEGLCGIYNKNSRDDLGLHSVRDADKFSITWKQTTTIFKGVPAFTTPSRNVSCSCQSGRQPVCRQGLDVYVCSNLVSGVTDITSVLISQAKTPLFNGQSQISQTQTRERRAVDDMQDTAKLDNGTIYTEETATQYCKNYLDNSTAVQQCASNLKTDAVNGSIQNCAEDLVALNDVEWAASHIDDLIAECLIDATTNSSAWDNNNNTDGPNLPENVVSELCTQKCSDHGSCVHGICDCKFGWTGDTCQTSSTSAPIVLPSQEPCDILTSPCASITVNGLNFVESEKLTCKIQYITIGNQVSLTGEEYIVKAELMSMIQVTCPQPSSMALSSQGRSALITVSNDGVTYSNESQAHILYKSTCQNCILSEDNQNITCTWKNYTCIIDNQCYSRGEVYEKSNCYKCDPDVSTTHWTKLSDPDCTPVAPSQIDVENNSSSNDDTAVIVLGVICGVLALVVVALVVVIYKIRANNKANMHGLLDREGSLNVYSSIGGPATRADLTGQSKADGSNDFYNPTTLSD